MSLKDEIEAIYPKVFRALKALGTPETVLSTAIIISAQMAKRGGSSRADYLATVIALTRDVWKEDDPS